MAGRPLVHHELCFGCGRQNLFGLLCELEPAGEARVAGRCFVKQDHQGPVPGRVHPGVIAVALIEALTFSGADLRGVELRFEADAPVGEYLDVEASADEAIARSQNRVVARALIGGV